MADIYICLFFFDWPISLNYALYSVHQYIKGSTTSDRTALNHIILEWNEVRENLQYFLLDSQKSKVILI